MKKASVSDLRTRLNKILKWLEEGESVAITRQGKVVAHLVLPTEASPTPMLEDPDPPPTPAADAAVAEESPPVEEVRPVVQEDRLTQLGQLLEHPMMSEDEAAAFAERG